MVMYLGSQMENQVLRILVNETSNVMPGVNTVFVGVYDVGESALSAQHSVAAVERRSHCSMHCPF